MNKLKEQNSNAAVVQMKISKSISACFPVTAIQQNGLVVYQLKEYLKLAEKIFKKGKKLWFINVKNDFINTDDSCEIQQVKLNRDQIQFSVKPLFKEVS